MAKARQNLKRRTYSATMNVVTKEDADRRDRLSARRNPMRAGVQVDNTFKGYPRHQEDVVIALDKNGNVTEPHVHDEHCMHPFTDEE